MLRVLVAIIDRPVAVITIRPVAIGVIAIRPSIIDRWRRRRGYIDPRGEDTAHDCSNTNPARPAPTAAPFPACAGAGRTNAAIPIAPPMAPRVVLYIGMHPLIRWANSHLTDHT